MPDFTLAEGVTVRCRNGNTYGPLRSLTSTGSYVWQAATENDAEIHHNWTADGRYWNTGRSSPYDIVEVVSVDLRQLLISTLQPYTTAPEGARCFQPYEIFDTTRNPYDLLESLLRRLQPLLKSEVEERENAAIRTRVRDLQSLLGSPL